jgi:hypothetical protein
MLPTGREVLGVDERMVKGIEFRTLGREEGDSMRERIDAQ